MKKRFNKVLRANVRKLESTRQEVVLGRLTALQQ